MKANTEHLNKRAFLTSGRSFVDDSIKAGLWGSLGALEHLHSLGNVRNDVTPSNIMLDDDGTFILIVIESCR